MWQRAKTGLHVLARPLFLCVKTCIQILLIAVGKSLSGPYPLAHGIVFSFVMVVFIVATYKIQPFNYGRYSLWEVASLIAVFYISMLSVLSKISDPTHIGWFIALAVGWMGIALVAYIVTRKRHPNLLISATQTNTRKSFRHGSEVHMLPSVLSMRDQEKGGSISIDKGDDATPQAIIQGDVEEEVLDQNEESKAYNIDEIEEESESSESEPSESDDESSSPEQEGESQEHVNSQEADEEAQDLSPS
jgi:hypothetical protein